MARFLDFLRLRAVWLALPLFLIVARPSGVSLAVGAVVALAGALLRGWASGMIRKDHVLTTAGPYAYTRNPLYLGTLLIGLGLAIAAYQIELLLLLVLLFAALYWPVMRRERRHLERLFGEEYREYAARVPALIPRPWPYRARDRAWRFQLGQYMKHREYQAALGTGFMFTLLILKSLVD